MKAHASTVAAACIITMLGACHLILGVEEKPFVPPEGSGGNAASSSGQGMGGNASQSSNSSSTASGMGGMMTTSTTSSSTNAGSGGTGGQGGATTTTTGGGGSKDTCDTCTGKDIGNVNVCAQQGNIETGIGWSYFDPSCLQDPNSSIHCLGQAQQGCRRCRQDWLREDARLSPSGDAAHRRRRWRQGARALPRADAGARCADRRTVR